MSGSYMVLGVWQRGGTCSVTFASNARVHESSGQKVLGKGDWVDDASYTLVRSV